MRMLAAAGCAAFIFALAAPVSADQNPSYSGPQSATETSFVKSLQADLMKRFATAADAEKAGYVRYTNEDETGAISYANFRWASSDSKHPSQLWYDANGKLLGADFSVLYKAGDARPKLWGVNPGRWFEFDEHIHWIGKDPTTGKVTYDNYVMADKFIAAGGDVKNPSADTLVKMAKVKAAADVTTIFDFPSVWDLIVWVKPNPNGAFANKNPLVHPTASTKSGM